MSAERVQKILAHAGIASRRKAEELITQGMVTINGQVAKLGDKAIFGQDAIKVNGKLITTTEDPIYVAFNKPKNVISMMSDPQGRPHLTDYLSKIRGRLFPIGRLDFSSEGLLLLTNDGAIAEKIQKSEKIPRVYHVKVAGHPHPDMISRLESGVRVGDRWVKPHSISLHEDLASKTRVEVVILGSGGDVRALFEMRGFRVDRIVRTAIGHITLHGLEAGAYRFLKKSQLEAIVETPEAAIQALAQEASERAERQAEEKARKEKYAAESGEKPTIKPASGGSKKRVVIGGGAAKARPSFGASEERPARAGYGARKPRTEGGERPARSGFGARKPRAEGGERPARSGFGGPRRPRAEVGERSMGAGRPARAGGRPPRGDGPSGRPAMKRSVRDAATAGLEPRAPRARTGFGSKKPAGRPARAGGFGSKTEGRPARAGGFGSKTRTSKKPFGKTGGAARPKRTR